MSRVLVLDVVSEVEVVLLVDVVSEVEVVLWIVGAGTLYLEWYWWMLCWYC